MSDVEFDMEANTSFNNDDILFFGVAITFAATKFIAPDFYLLKSILLSSLCCAIVKSPTSDFLYIVKAAAMSMGGVIAVEIIDDFPLIENLQFVGYNHDQLIFTACDYAF